MAERNQSSEDYKVIAAKWVAGQPFTNVLLCAILLSFGYCLYYAMTVVIPSHLQTIQEGYEKLDDTHMKERDTIRRQFEGWLDRIDNMRSGKSSALPLSANHNE